MAEYLESEFILNGVAGRCHYCNEQYPGAIPNGTTVIKIYGEAEDTHPVGSIATVVGSVGIPTSPTIFYFVYWDGDPKGMFVGVTDYKIKPV